MVKAKERRVVTVSRNGLTTRVLNVAVTDSLDAVCDKVEEQLSLTANSVILYLDKKMDKVLDDDAYRTMKADATIYLPDPKEVTVDGDGEDSSDGDELETPPPAVSKADDKARRDGLPRAGELPKICYLDPDTRRPKLLAKKQCKLNPAPDKDGAMDAFYLCFYGPLRDIGLLAMICEDMTEYPTEKKINAWTEQNGARSVMTVNAYHVVASPYAPPFMHFPTLRVPDPDKDEITAEPIEVTLAWLDEQQIRRIDAASPHGARWARLWLNLVDPDDSLDPPTEASVQTACTLVFSAEDDSKNPLKPEDQKQVQRLAVAAPWSFENFCKVAKESYTDDFKEEPEEPVVKKKGKGAAGKAKAKAKPKGGQKRRLRGDDSSSDDEPAAKAPRKRRRKKLDWQRP